MKWRELQENYLDFEEYEEMDDDLEPEKIWRFNVKPGFKIVLNAGKWKIFHVDHFSVINYIDSEFFLLSKWEFSVLCEEQEDAYNVAVEGEADDVELPIEVYKLTSPPVDLSTEV